ncbi:MAG TPA: methylated-DNA--[protein]-cysteine S-methyltransferase [Pseudomonadales bacterium]|nr:methylated-DNA--[protein]-cysteine S-methyltransferase [Pseudomonadales bacterium]MDP6316317.1 methylated-DNA--[protein]-cysteine S-methyltransferase [Pseudomonadales bacterium]MDP7314907.1 methylated-DNA--[protein]-cysteine S-methyltransferase [Pseudomonadales bacterium]HJP50339.1 methylated-DNA--[protein]-cysteine S-methyltransferase [Pseudomonadales bacterium]
MADSQENIKHQVWQIVNAIPQGSVATYGQVARLAGAPQHSRLVGRIISQLPRSTRLPWHRVINSQGKISNPNPKRQQDRLEQEGIVVLRGRISLKQYQWQTD